MSTKNTIHREWKADSSGDVEEDIHIYYEPGINTEAEGVYLYIFKRGSGDVLVKLEHLTELSNRLTSYVEKLEMTSQ